MMGVLAVFAGLLAAPVEARDPEKRPVISAVDAALHGERLRVSIALSRRAAFRLALLDEPRRLVVDLPEIAWAAEATDGVPGWLGTVRHGLFRPGQARLVFALERPLRIARGFTQPAAPGRLPRLVVDLVPTDPESFAAAAGTRGAARWETEADKRPLRVALDPGHGGRDPGAIVGGLVEKDLVLGFATEFAAALAARPGMEAVLTRSGDTHLPLAERVARARTAGADLMISLHADRLAKGAADGLTLYSLGPGDTANALVRGEGRDALLEGSRLAGEPDELAELLVGLARRDTVPASEALARSLLGELDGTVALLDKRPHRHGDFAVLRAADLPAVLVELGFLDSGADRARLRSRDWRQRTIDGLIRGIAAWADGLARGTGVRGSANDAKVPGMSGAEGTKAPQGAFVGETSRTSGTDRAGPTR